MSNGNFSQFGVGERRLSDVEEVQAPVVDKSSLVRDQAMTEGVVGLVKTGASAFGAAMGIQQGQALSAAQKDFESKLFKAGALAEQHGSESPRFRTYLTGAFQGSELDFDTKTKMMKDFQATTLGKVLVERNPEEEALAEMTQKAYAAGYMVRGMSEEEQEVGFSEYQQFILQQRADEQDIANFKRTAFKEGMTPEQLAVSDRKLREKSFKALSNLAANYRTPVKNFVSDVVRRLEIGELDSASAKQLLEGRKGDLNATIGLLSRNVPENEVKALANPLTGLLDVAIARVNSGTRLSDINNDIAMMTAKAARNQLVNDPELVQLLGMSSLVQHNSPPLTARISTKTIETLKKNSKEGALRPADITENSQDRDVYLEVITEGIDNLNRTDIRGEPMVKEKELLTNVDNIFKGAARFMSEDDAPTENKKLLEWLAKPRVGEFIKDNLKSITPEARVGLADTVIKNATNYVYPAVKGMIESEFKVEGKVSGVNEDDVEMLNRGGKLSFHAKTSDPWTKSVVQKLNREVGGALNTYFNATANLTDDSFESVFERERALIWPSKYGEEEATPAPQAVPINDPLKYSGQVVEDEKGDRWASRGGTWVKIGSANDGSK